MPYVLVGDVKLFYTEQGQGELLILVHGSLGDYRDWGNQTSVFSASGFRVVSYSRRNHFPNPWKDYPLNYSLLTERDDLLHLIKELGEPTNLVGHSYGAYAAALVARDNSDYVRKLVLAEPPIFTMLNEGKNFSLALTFMKDTIEPGKKFLRNNDVESGIKIFLDGISGLKDVYDRLKPAFRRVMLDNARTALPEIEITPKRDPFDCTDASRITTPTLLVVGEGSPKALQSVIIELSKCIPNSEIAKISKASHGMIWDNPRLFNERVLKFLRKSDK